jgi:hypothetical protein
MAAHGGPRRPMAARGGLSAAAIRQTMTAGGRASGRGADESGLPESFYCL